MLKFLVGQGAVVAVDRGVNGLRHGCVKDGVCTGGVEKW